jgi:hypothetical protein
MLVVNGGMALLRKKGCFILEPCDTRRNLVGKKKTYERMEEGWRRKEGNEPVTFHLKRQWHGG